MALVQTSTPYRQMWPVTSNVAEDKRYCGAFSASTTDASLGTFVRPSAGPAAAPGAGELFTVSVPTAGTFIWLVQILETAIQPVYVRAGMNFRATTAGTGGSIPLPPTAPAGTANAGALTLTNKPLTVQCSVLDVPATGSSGAAALSNSFYIWLTDTDGTIPAASLTAPTNFAGGLHIWFEVLVKPTMVPASR
jgi:hypothetical protein